MIIPLGDTSSMAETAHLGRYDEVNSEEKT